MYSEVYSVTKPCRMQCCSLLAEVYFESSEAAIAYFRVVNAHRSLSTILILLVLALTLAFCTAHTSP
jgi:hypothetical protein